MATVFGQPGGGAAKRGLLYVIAGPTAILFLALWVGGIVVWALGRWGLLAALLLVAVAGWVIWLNRDDYREMLSMHSEGRQWLKGAAGEYRTHTALAGLPAEFAAFHDYQPVLKGKRQRWNIDHLVVGPTGVFVIETKHYSHPRVSSANSWNVRNVKQTQRNAMDVRDQLSTWSGGELDSVFVVPLLVYVQDNAFVERTRQGSVRVIPLKWLEGEILSHSERNIDLEQAGRVVRVLYTRMDMQMRVEFAPELAAYGAISKQARFDKRDAAIAAAAERAGAAPASPSAVTSPAAAEEPCAPAVCPRCGAPLVERVAKKGERAGRRFLGCSKWSATGGCRYIFNLE